MKYLADLRAKFGPQPAFRYRDLALFLEKMGAGRGYTKLLAHNLLKKGELKKITRGAYTFNDDAQLVGFAFSPFYYGLQDALSLRNLWEQETTPVVITPRKVRAGLRIFEGTNYLVRRIERKMFFGFEYVRYFNYWIPVSDIEKTLIDFVYFSVPLQVTLFKKLGKMARKDILHGYLKRCPGYVRKKFTD